MGRTSPFLSSYRLRFLTHRTSNEKTTFKGMSTRIDEEILTEPETLTEPYINGHKMPILARNWSALQGWEGGAHWGTGLSPSSWFNREIDRVRGKALPSWQTDELQNNHWLVRLREAQRQEEGRVRVGKGMDVINCQAPLLTLLGWFWFSPLAAGFCWRIRVSPQEEEGKEIVGSGLAQAAFCGLYLCGGHSFEWLCRIEMPHFLELFFSEAHGPLPLTPDCGQVNRWDNPA